MRLLMIEDDPFFGKIIEDCLRSECYAIDWLTNGDDAELALKVCTYDLLLLDLNLPGRRGIDILKAMRLSGQDLPVLIISSHDAKSTHVEGLDAGADDYLVKPFVEVELQARVRALLRRVGRRSNSTMTHGPVTLNLTNHEATFKGQSVKLPRREFSVLRMLLSQPGRVVSKRQIEEKLYDWNTEVSSNTVDVHVCQLRKKFGTEFIQTLRGVGYKIPLLQG